ncbi:MAG: PIG-L family deacetylase [Chloroflexota bacterium]|nr:PIG-L family deacetylase [Chloroflexota bacterium]
MKTLLAVHAHPDDETIGMGGTLARYSDEGVRTVVVTCTSGDLGEVHLPGVPVEEGLARLPDLSQHGGVGSVRQRELEAAAGCLGVSRLANLGYFDSGMAGWTSQNHRPGAFFAADLAEAAGRLVRVIAEERPQVLVTYDETGGYAHPDHLKAHQVAVAAFQASGEARPAKLYFMRIPLGWSRKFVRALREAGIDAPASAAAGADAGPAVHEIGVLDRLVTTTIDIRGYVAVKRAALAKHASQMPPDHFLMRMPPALAEKLWRFEYFSRERGPTNTPSGETETDLFSGLA